ncbi:MAG: helix-turn-helix domain-containing protein [Lentisphaeria bacterium]|nr:helix-turn-helix domain-containing protein [Lentisphaeria bacterium]
MIHGRHFKIDALVSKDEIQLTTIYQPPGKDARRYFHDHNFSEIVLILSGTGVHICDGKQYPIRGGDVLLLHPGVTHGYDHQDLELVNIVYDAKKLILPIYDGASMPLFRKFFPDPQESFQGQAKPLLSLQAEDQKKIFGLVHDLMAERTNDRPGCRLFSQVLFLEIIIALCRLHQESAPAEKTPFRIGEALEYMNQYYDHAISIEQLARKACMSRWSLFHHFKKAVGCSPIQYLIQIRVSRAMELLRYTELHIGEIAYQCGFPDSNYFCKVFRMQAGISPREFRQKKPLPCPTPSQNAN